MTVRPFQACSRFLFCAAVVAVLLCVPYAASAAVFIHEIAWMGTSVSANDEWIELYNDGASAVDLSGWVLSDGDALAITLSGSVGAGNYFLLERTDDDTVPGVTAGVIYTGALGNDGRTLTLTRADSGVEDQVAGGQDWSSIGGDNTTKHTAQLTNGGWLTAAATPGAANATEASDTDEEDDADETDVSDTTEDDEGVRISMVQAPHTPALFIKGNTTLHAGGSTTLTLEPSGLSAKLIPSLAYEWNFGDGTVGIGKSVAHTYRHPGVYAVTARAHFAHYESFARMTVTVLPIALALERSPEGYLYIHNDSLVEMDISGYRIVDGSDAFTFPPRTFILPKGTITLTPAMLGRTSISQNVYAQGSQGRTIALNERTAQVSIEQAIADAPLASMLSSQMSPEPKPEAEEVDDTPLPIGLGAALVTADSSIPFWVTYGGLGVVIIIGLLAVFFRNTQA